MRSTLQSDVERLAAYDNAFEHAHDTGTCALPTVNDGQYIITYYRPGEVAEGGDPFYLRDCPQEGE